MYNDNAFYVIEAFVTQRINVSENQIHLIINRKVAIGVLDNASTLITHIQKHKILLNKAYTYIHLRMA